MIIELIIKLITALLYRVKLTYSLSIYSVFTLFLCLSVEVWCI